MFSEIVGIISMKLNFFREIVSFFGEGCELRFSHGDFQEFDIFSWEEGLRLL